MRKNTPQTQSISNTTQPTEQQAHQQAESSASLEEEQVTPETTVQTDRELIDLQDNQARSAENDRQDNTSSNNIPAILARGEHEAEQAYKGQWAFLIIPMAVTVLSSVADTTLKLLRILIPGGQAWLGFVQGNIFNFLQNIGVAATSWATLFENYATYTGNENSPGIKEVYNEIMRLYSDIDNTPNVVPQEVLRAKRYFIVNTAITAVIGTILPIISFLVLSVGTLDAELKKTKNNSPITSNKKEPIIDPWIAFTCNLVGNLINIAAIILIFVSHRVIAPKLNTILAQANHKLKTLKAEQLEQEQNKKMQLNQELEDVRSKQKEHEHSQQNIEKALQTLAELHDWYCDNMSKIASENALANIEELKQKFTHKYREIELYLQPNAENTSSSFHQRRGIQTQTSALSELAFEQQTDLAALESQRSITRIKIGEESKYCQIVPAQPDGNCGFTSIHHSLHVQGFDELAKKITRRQFIKLVKALAQADDTSDRVKDLITHILRVDNADTLDIWCTKFQSSGYWLQDAHLQLLSHIYNLRFEIYYVPAEIAENSFQAEPSYEAIDEGTGAVATIALAHVSTKSKEKQDATLNHFDAIIIEPTESQLQKIENLKKQVNNERHSARTISQKSLAQLITTSSPLFTKPSTTSMKDISVINEGLNLHIKSYPWQLEQAADTVSLTLVDKTNLSESLLNELKKIIAQTFNLGEHQITLESQQLHIHAGNEALANHIKGCIANSELKPISSDKGPFYPYSK